MCFPEAYLPGLRGLDFEVPPFDRRSRNGRSAPWRSGRGRTGWPPSSGWSGITDAGRQIAAVVLDAGGEVLGCQTKNQLDPTEEPLYVPGTHPAALRGQRAQVRGGDLPRGVPLPRDGAVGGGCGAPRSSSIRTARGATGRGSRLTQWGSPDGPYYEKAMMCRGLENTIYFASVNYAFRYQESATSLIGPSGECLAHLPYGQEGVLVQAIDPEAATGLLASRYAPERYQETPPA